ncbi:MAG: cytochrome oxidase small assembly protein [Moraxellaceae bacterium]|nr:cytochrome oxidase small assembly protein [Moraxellaceae bacterium]
MVAPRSSNVRLLLILLSMAAVFFIGYIVKIWLLGR